jgi:hypothetical protein
VGAPPLEGDPCIGKLVKGEDFLIKIKRVEHQTDEGITERLFQSIGKFERFVTITSAKVVKTINL